MLTNQIFLLIRHTNCESFHVSTSDMNTRQLYENTQKHNKIKGPSITCSYIWHQTQMSLNFVILFSDIQGNVFDPKKCLENKKYLTFNKHFRPVCMCVLLSDCHQIWYTRKNIGQVRRCPV